MTAYLSKKTQHQYSLILLMTRQRPTKDVTVMSTSAAAAGSNDNVLSSIAQELVFGGKIKIRLIRD